MERLLALGSWLSWLLAARSSRSSSFSQPQLRSSCLMLPGCTAGCQAIPERWERWRCERDVLRSSRVGGVLAGLALGSAAPRQRPLGPGPWCGPPGPSRSLRAKPPPLELMSEFDSEDPELRMEAANQVGAGNVTSTLWPPKRCLGCD